MKKFLIMSVEVNVVWNFYTKDMKKPFMLHDGNIFKELIEYLRISARSAGE